MRTGGCTGSGRVVQKGALYIWLSCALHGDKVNPELAPDTLTVGDGEPSRNRQGSRSSGSVDKIYKDSGTVSISPG